MSSSFPMDGMRVRFAGDTNVFSDMAIIRDLYAPRIVMLPIGDHYTMGPGRAAYAVKLVQPKMVIPMHFATFPVLTGTPEAFATALKLQIDKGDRKRIRTKMAF